MLVRDVSEIFLPIPVYLVAVLTLLCVRAFRRRGSRLRRFRYVVLGLVVWSYAFSTPAIAHAVAGRLERAYPRVTDPKPSADALIVVLASGFLIRVDGRWQTRLDAAGWERTYAAIALWRRTGGELLFVGQPGPRGQPSVATVMAELAIASGVPPSVVHTENESRNTHENIEYNRERIAGHRGKVWLVTSAMHMPRAMAVVHKIGLEVTPYPCDYRATESRRWHGWLPSSTGPALLSEALHEIIGLFYYRLRGRAA